MSSTSLKLSTPTSTTSVHPPKPPPLPFTPFPPLPSHITIAPLTPALLPHFRRTISLLLPIRYPETFYTTIISDAAASRLARAAVWHDRPNPTNIQKRKRKRVQREQERDEGEEDEEWIKIGSAEASSENGRATNPEPEPKGSDLHLDNHGNEASDEALGPGHVVGGIRCRIEPLPTPPSTSRPQPHCTLYIQALALLSPYRGHGIATHLLSSVISSALQEHPGLISVYAHVWEANEEGLEWYRRRGFVVEEEVVEGYYRRLRPGGARVVRRSVGVRDWLGVERGAVEGKRGDKGGKGG